MKDGEITLSAACTKYMLDPVKLERECRRREHGHPKAVAKTPTGEIILSDNWELRDYAKSQRRWWVRFADFIRSIPEVLESALSR